jgi:hypothetical protein
MAKCIQHKEQADLVKRVGDKVAADSVATGKWQYIGKSVYRRLTNQLSPREKELEKQGIL